MNRAIYIGGALNGKLAAETVAEGIAKAAEAEGHPFDAVYPFTFSQAMDRPIDVTRRAVQGATVYTHSAGFMALAGTHPREIHAFNAPMRTSRRELVRRTAVKMARMHLSDVDMVDVARFDISAAGEIVAHPWRNLWPVINGNISRFSGVKAALSHLNDHSRVTLVTTDQDDYFQMPPHIETTLRTFGGHLIRLPGQHDELVLRPEETLRAYAEQKQQVIQPVLQAQ